MFSYETFFSMCHFVIYTNINSLYFVISFFNYYSVCRGESLNYFIVSLCFELFSFPLFLCLLFPPNLCLQCGSSDLRSNAIQKHLNHLRLRANPTLLTIWLWFPSARKHILDLTRRTASPHSHRRPSLSLCFALRGGGTDGTDTACPLHRSRRAARTTYPSLQGQIPLVFLPRGFFSLSFQRS